MVSAAIVDYGMGNLFSMERALMFLGARPCISSDPSFIRRSDRIILPGVGAFGQAMAGLREKGLDEAIREAGLGGARILGICLGLQLLMTESSEHGLHRGLDLVHGSVTRLPQGKVPQVGWNEVLMPRRGGSWGGTILQRVPPGSAMYFVHSYMAKPSDQCDVLAETLYEGVLYPSVIRRGNVCGCQFHPEKSGASGLGILREFMEV